MRRLRALTWLNAKPKPCASGHGPRRMFASVSWQMILDMDGVLYKNAEVENEIIKRLGKATEKLGLGPDAHQELFRSHGSTLRGAKKHSAASQPHMPHITCKDCFPKVIFRETPSQLSMLASMTAWTSRWDPRRLAMPRSDGSDGFQLYRRYSRIRFWPCS